MSSEKDRRLAKQGWRKTDKGYYVKPNPGRSKNEYGHPNEVLSQHYSGNDQFDETNARITKMETGKPPGG